MKREAEEKRRAALRANEEREQKAQERATREQQAMAAEAEERRVDQAPPTPTPRAAVRSPSARGQSPPIPALRPGGSGANANGFGNGNTNTAAPGQQHASSGSQQRTPPAPRPPSPPLPAMAAAARRGGNGGGGVSSSPEARPSSSRGRPPSAHRAPPAHTAHPPAAAERERERTPAAAPAAKGKSTHDVMQQLSQLRDRLAREQKKSDHQLQRGQEQFQRLQANAQQRQLKGSADVFERVRRQTSERTPGGHGTATEDGAGREGRSDGGTHATQDGDAPSVAALGVFNQLKYGKGLGDGRAKEEFMQVRQKDIGPELKRKKTCAF